MTEIKIYGILGKIFGNSIKINVCQNSTNYIINIIDSVKNGFRKKINELYMKGQNYCIVKKNNEIHILPYIGGLGKVVNYIVGGLLIVVGIILCFFPPTAMLGVALILAGANLIIQTALTPDPETPEYQNAVGGQVGSVDSNGKSFIFNNLANYAKQGVPIPVGYGRLVVGSRLIYGSIKNYSTSSSFFSESRSSSLINFSSMYD